MSIDTNRTLLEFNNLSVHSHSRRTLDIHDINNHKPQKNTSTSYKVYKKWLSKLKTNVILNKERLTQQRALVSGASGALLSGQVTVLTGASGSGKSVLLRVLAGLVPLSSGSVHFCDDKSNNTYHSIDEAAPTQWRKQVTLLAQHPQLLEGSVLKNLQMPYQLHAHHSQNFDIDWHLTQLKNLNRNADFLQQDTNHLSGGERQLVNTLRLLQLNPQVLLLDEPTAALDVESSAQLVNLLVSWLQADVQRTILWVTHDTKDIMPLADNHWRMQAGLLNKNP